MPPKQKKSNQGGGAKLDKNVTKPMLLTAEERSIYIKNSAYIKQLQDLSVCGSMLI